MEETSRLGSTAYLLFRCKTRRAIDCLRHLRRIRSKIGAKIGASWFAACRRRWRPPHGKLSGVSEWHVDEEGWCKGSLKMNRLSSLQKEVPLF
jgi:hypothetical protein